MSTSNQCKIKTIKENHKDFQGRHTGARVAEESIAAPERELLVGVSGRRRGDSRSARRMNCRAVRGEPGEDDLMDRGLVPLGVESANEGIYEFLGSGVRGGSGICDWDKAEELIHFSSRLPKRGGDSGRSRNASAK